MFVEIDWPAPSRVRALSTTREGGGSRKPFHTLNLGSHVGDVKTRVEQNRQQLLAEGRLPASPIWLDQQHGCCVHLAKGDERKPPRADAAVTSHPGVVCTVMTADCLPILLTDDRGYWVAAIHGGWRGLQQQIISQTVERYAGDPKDLMAWLGPAIGPKAFEVGPEVREAFTQLSPKLASAFVPAKGRYLADLYKIARFQLQQLGIQRVFGGGFCTYSDKQRFFSYRRDEVTGRMATMIWIDS